MRLMYHDGRRRRLWKFSAEWDKWIKIYLKYMYIRLLDVCVCVCWVQAPGAAGRSARANIHENRLFYIICFIPCESIANGPEWEAASNSKLGHNRMCGYVSVAALLVCSRYLQHNLNVCTQFVRFTLFIRISWMLEISWLWLAINNSRGKYDKRAVQCALCVIQRFGQISSFSSFFAVAVGPDTMWEMGKSIIGWPFSLTRISRGQSVK